MVVRPRVVKCMVDRQFQKPQRHLASNVGVCVCVCVCVCVHAHAQLCLTLCDPMDYSRPGSSVHGILQARRLEWVVVSFSRELGDFSTKTMSKG